MNRRRFIPAAMVIVVTVAAYLPLLGNGFVLQDDTEWIESNPWLNPPSIANIIQCWKHPTQGLYVPVTYTFWSALALLGTRPVVFHAASIALHVLSALMVLAILRQLSFDDLPATIGAMLFAFHPLQVESVAWASGMKDVLAGLLSLLVIDQYLRHVRAERSSTQWHLHYAAAIVAMALGVLAKPSAIMAPVIAGAIDVMLVRKSLGAAIERLWPMALLIVPCIAWSRAVQPAWPETITPLWTRPLIAGDALAFYLWKLIWPVGLTSQYGRTPQSVVASHVIYYMWLIPIAVGGLIAILGREVQELRCGLVVFVLGVLPILGLTPFMFQLNSTVADHYVYLAMLGPAIAVAGLMTRAIAAKQLRLLMSSLMALAALLVLSVFQQMTWKDSVTLFTQAVLVNPSNTTAHGYLGTALATTGRYKEAVRHFRVVVKANPQSPMAWIYLGRALEASGQPGDAYRELTAAKKQFPDDAGIAAELENVRRRFESPTTNR